MPMVRGKEGEADFHLTKDTYDAVDDICTILKVEKQSENLYTVQARCDFDGKDPLIPSTIRTDEFELVGKDKLLITHVGS